MTQQSRPGHRSERTGEQGPESYLHIHVHDSTAHNSHEAEATPVFTENAWTDRMWYIFTYDGVPTSLRKDGNSDARCHRAEPRGHQAK